jgi:hypothetical protein
MKQILKENCSLIFTGNHYLLSNDIGSSGYYMWKKMTVHLLRQDILESYSFFRWGARDHLTVTLELPIVKGVSKDKNCMLPFHCEPLKEMNTSVCRKLNNGKP